MFSSFGQIIGVKPRQAETTDTRLGIRRHDPDYEQNKKKKEDNQNPIGFDEDDNAIVSIEALQIFLQNFLKSSADGKPKPAPRTPETYDEAQGSLFDDGQTPRNPKPNVQAQRAASAYQHSAEAAHKGTLLSTADRENAVTIGENLGLGSAEIRTIHSLIDDLKALSARNIEYLRIERSDSFLQSLVNAVAKIKH